MTIHEARLLLTEMTESVSLLRHMRTVELVMTKFSERVPGANPEKWAIAGLLHDADYEKYPDQHPQIIVEKLRELAEPEIAHAISAHYTKWGVPYESELDKALLACDEITGFIVACALIRPDNIEGLKPKSVLKRLRNKKFAASVDREEVHKGVELIGADLSEHISFIIDVLKENKAELFV